MRREVGSTTVAKSQLDTKQKSAETENVVPYAAKHITLVLAIKGKQ